MYKTIFASLLILTLSLPVSSAPEKVKDNGKFMLAQAGNASNNASDYYNQGRISYLQCTRKGFSDAIAYYDKALEIDRNHALSLAGKAEALALLSTFYSMVKQDLKQAELETKAHENAFIATKVAPDLVEARRALSLSLIMKGLYKEAETEAKKAVNLNQYDAEAHLMLWLSTKKPKLDDEEINKAMGLNPYIPITPLIYANVSFNQNDNRRTVNLLNKVLELNPNNDIAYSVLGIISLFDNNNNDQAIKYVEKAVEIDPFNKDLGYINYVLGRAYFNKWNMGKAVELQTKGCDLDYQASCDWLNEHGRK